MVRKPCPNGCINGFIYNAWTGQKIECEYCKAARDDALSKGIDGESVLSTLGISDSLLQRGGCRGSYFLHGISTDSLCDVFDTSGYITYDQSAVAKVKTAFLDLYKGASGGLLSTDTYIFNLGPASDELYFVVPYLLKCYEAGFLLSPLLNPYSLTGLFSTHADTLSESDLSGYADSDVLVLLLSTHAPAVAYSTAVSLLQLRALKGKGTIVFLKEDATSASSLISSSALLSEAFTFVHAHYYSVIAKETGDAGESASPAKVKKSVSAPKSAKVLKSTPLADTETRQGGLSSTWD